MTNNGSSGVLLGSGPISARLVESERHEVALLALASHLLQGDPDPAGFTTPDFLVQLVLAPPANEGVCVQETWRGQTVGLLNPRDAAAYRDSIEALRRAHGMVSARATMRGQRRTEGWALSVGLQLPDPLWLLAST